MGELVRNLVVQIKEFYKTLSPMKRVAMTSAIAVSALAAVVISVMVSGSDHVVLLANIPSDQMGLISETMKKKNIPFKIGENGNSILVPKDLLHSSQMALMSEIGSGKIGQVGLELFDKQDFGTTSYQQRINYQRALQGELMRAINSLEVVKQSKVMLALPAKKTFLEDTEPPTASVVVDLYPGKQLSEEQIRGITHLVANAVEGLDPDHVSVLDARGKLLSKRSDAAFSGSTELFEVKQKIQREYQDRVEALLARVVGEGRVKVQVDATLNTQKMSMVQESVDPDKTAIKSVQSEEESLNGNRSNPTGVPGSRANLPGAQDAGTVAFNQDVKKELKTTNYEVPKTVKNVEESAGRLERLSVAVIVDGITEVKTNDKGETETVWKARSPEELTKFENLVKSAIGFSETRGDSIKIENVQFKEEDFAESERILKTLHRERVLRFMASWGLALFAIALLFFVVVRPFMRWVTDSFQDSVEDMLPKTIEELEELQSADDSLPGMTGALPMLTEALDPDKAESELLKERIMKIVEEDNEKASGAFSLWLVRKDT